MYDGYEVIYMFDSDCQGIYINTYRPSHIYVCRQKRPHPTQTKKKHIRGNQPLSKIIIFHRISMVVLYSSVIFQDLGIRFRDKNIILLFYTLYGIILLNFQANTKHYLAVSNEETITNVQLINSLEYSRKKD
jgi:hypothetical protein